MKTNNYLVTKEGLEKLKQELETRTNKREELKEALDSARSKGDLRENDGYTLAVEDYQNNEAEIARLTEVITKSEVVESKDKNKVEVGDTVVVKDKDGNKKTFVLVGEGEADPMKNQISYHSPIGKALIGKFKGDKVKFSTPAGKQEFTIVETE
ncbi:MAG TPA: GreA/GreB family elongation factor [Candidatus Dojkabacteria bacterium]|nr:GreA/GreB family elongation factor [Candidatus Dojkabacteria bacterium]